ncbi:MAG TPA: UDP-2,3-diacylglucosamine diphosphatase [Nevskiaceae bacterium]|nr:UDP-2,3-diacylglucosamine diphosphatase [Nevskiaceae bacterium]
MATSWLLSDLHLPPRPSPLRETLLDWLRSPRLREAQAVYLLGDVFEAWIGDDLGLDWYRAEIDALAALSAAGVAVKVQVGNRDFLLGAAFARASGAVLLADPVVEPLGGVPTLLSHGDLWCTDDRAYQRWRRFARWRPAQRLFLALPRGRREAIARGLRDSSRAATRVKPDDILDVNEAAIAAAVRASGARRVIHGHTHRPAEHWLQSPTGPVERLVLADWHPQRCEVLGIAPGGDWWRQPLTVRSG